MSLAPQHIAKSLDNIRKNHSELYRLRKKDIEKLIAELHKWFDLFSEKPLAEFYGYVDRRAMRHREQRHHWDGIIAATYVFTKKYGEEFRVIIAEESEQHIRDDFFMLDDFDKIPQMDDYLTPGFWNKIFGYRKDL